MQDTFAHEQCLVITQDDGRTLLSGCAHNGIVNILDRYYAVYGSYPDRVISGFHMMQKTEYTKEDIRIKDGYGVLYRTLYGAGSL